MGEDLTRDEILQRLDIGLRRMPKRRRMIFLAVRLDGASYAELAERTGLSIRQVEREVAAALVQLDRAAHDDPSGCWWHRWFRFLAGRGRP